LSVKNVLSWVISVTMIGLGIALISFFFLSRTSGEVATNEPDPNGFNVPEVETAPEEPATAPETAEAPEPEGPAENEEAARAPEDTTLTLTVPGMSRLQDATIPYAAGNDEGALRDNAGIHLEGTGFPWEEEANVYIAGHRLGYPGTDSFLAFYDQQNLEEGDEILVTDSEGTEYTYRVFEELVVRPTEVYVTRPEPGRNILTLQTCTLPDYSERIITRAELVDTAQRA
jgi:sortase A